MKTYKQFKKFLRDKCWNERDYGEWIYDKLIYDFLVEEVKENKELDKALAERLEYPYEMTYAKDTSILEKLKDWVDKELKLEGYEHKQILDKIDLLTSLETKEEPVPPSDKWREQYIADWGVCPICWDHEIASSFDRDAYNPWYDYSCSNGHSWSDKDGEVQPQFTPWQEVVQWPHEPCTWNMSNEESEEAIRKSDEYNEKHFPGYKEFKENNQKEYNTLLTPTPWQEDKIEPELPDFEWSSTDYSMFTFEQMWAYIDEQAWQIEALTKFCQALSRQKPTK